MNVSAILEGRYPKELIAAVLTAYKEVEQNYFLGKWKASELDSGHFVEASRRMLQHALLGSFTPVGSQLPYFNESELKRLEQAQGPESLRILIPRALWSVNGIRNKRGVGHLGAVSPNKMDSSFILGVVKWVLAEFVRDASGRSPSETQAAVDAIVERQIDLLWKHDDITRVLDPKIPARDQILLLLYDHSPQTIDALRSAIEYANSSAFERITTTLHNKRLVEYNRNTGQCVITSRGIVAAEEIALTRRLIT